MHGGVQGFVQSLRHVAAAVGAQLCQLLLKGRQVVGEIGAAHEVGVASVAVGHQAVADVGLARQVRDLLGHGTHRALELVDLVGHRAGGVDQEGDVELRLRWRASSIGQRDLKLVLLATLQQRRAARAALAIAHLHFEQRGAQARYRCQRVQPGAAGGIGAGPQRQRARAGKDGHFGVGHRAAARVVDDQGVALLHIAGAHWQLRAALAVGEVGAEVGVVIDHTRGHRLVGRAGGGCHVLEAARALFAGLRRGRRTQCVGHRARRGRRGRRHRFANCQRRLGRAIACVAVAAAALLRAVPWRPGPELERLRRARTVACTRRGRCAGLRSGPDHAAPGAARRL